MDLLGRDVTLAALSAGSRFASRRLQLIQENTANINTPGYKRRDLDGRAFCAELVELLDSGAEREDVSSALRATQAREVVDEQFSFRVDKSNVDPDREGVAQAQASLLGAAISALMVKRLQMYRSVLRDGRV